MISCIPLNRQIMSIKALVLVDIQNDFLPGGALAVSQGNEILPIIDNLLSQFLRISSSQQKTGTPKTIQALPQTIRKRLVKKSC